MPVNNLHVIQIPLFQSPVKVSHLGSVSHVILHVSQGTDALPPDMEAARSGVSSGQTPTEEYSALG